MPLSWLRPSRRNGDGDEPQPESDRSRRRRQAHRPGRPVTGPVVTDSRLATEGALFVAVHGERTDGHAHLGSAGALGAVGAIVSDLEAARSGLIQGERGETEDPSMGLVLVEDTVTALGALASTHLAGLRRTAADRGERLTVVAMTGSVGKTTTKDSPASSWPPPVPPSPQGPASTTRSACR